MTIPPFVSTFVIPAICILLTIACRKLICLLDEYSKNNSGNTVVIIENDQHIKNSKVKRLQFIRTIIEAICFFLPTIGGVLIFNAIFMLFKQHSIVVESVMSYSDTLLAMISLVASMAIAFFQYRIQEKIEQSHNFQEEQTKKFQESIRKMELEHHYQELCSQRIRDLKSLDGLTGRAVNRKIIESCTDHTSSNTNRDLYIELGVKNNTTESKFYHSFFSLNSNNDWDKCIRCTNGPINVLEISPHHLCFSIDINNDAIIDFVSYPIQNKRKKSSRPKLQCSFEARVTDYSIGKDNTDNLMNMEIHYKIDFDIEPQTFGYTPFGEFPICITNSRLTVLDINHITIQ